MEGGRKGERGRTRGSGEQRERGTAEGGKDSGRRARERGRQGR